MTKYIVIQNIIFVKHHINLKVLSFTQLKITENCYIIFGMIKQLLGKRIKEIRKFKKLTQEQLAEYIGIETSSVSNIENGRYFPTAENLDKIMQILQIMPAELFMTEYNKEQDILIQELVSAMNKDKKLTKLIYKFYLAVKYQD